MTLFSNRELALMIEGTAWFLLHHGKAWREERWAAIRHDPQVGADLSTLYYLEATRAAA